MLSPCGASTVHRQMTIDPRQPVIVGVADIIDRIKDAAQARHPLQLLESAIHEATHELGGHWLSRVDSIDIVQQMSWPYLDLPGQLRSVLRLPAGTRIEIGPVGGESPLRLIQNAALRVIAGEAEVCIVAGAETLGTVIKAASAKATLPWPSQDPNYRRIRAEDISPPESLKYGLRSPIDVYPLYENACRAHWRQSFDAAQTESAAIWSQFSAVAENNPYAWLPRRHSVEEIKVRTPDNRAIAWPYWKLMVANNAVNQSAAVVVTTYATARAAGVSDEQLAFIWDGCGADDPRSVLGRDVYWHSPAQDTVLKLTLQRNHLCTADLDLIELYSCFPCVPKMARRTLGLRLEDGPFTVAGGLTFFGAPANNYMLHATTAMVRALRKRSGKIGLLYGQGEFVTKHHALVVAASPQPAGVQTQSHSVQEQSDATRGAVPALHDGYVGSGSVESFTVFFDRAGEPHQGVVIARNDAGARFVARIPGSDAAALAQFTNPSWEPIASRGQSTQAADGLVDWRPHT
jgi:acetyl-CoA C-acetyltransferase